MSERQGERDRGRDRAREKDGGGGGWWGWSRRRSYTEVSGRKWNNGKEKDSFRGGGLKLVGNGVGGNGRKWRRKIMVGNGGGMDLQQVVVKPNGTPGGSE